MGKQPFISHAVNGYSRYDMPENNHFKAPSALSGFWSYTDHQTGAVYLYRIPRYYDKYLSQDVIQFFCPECHSLIRCALRIF